MERGERPPEEVARQHQVPITESENRPDLTPDLEPLGDNRELTDEVEVTVETPKVDSEPKAFEKLPEEVQAKLLNQMLEGMRQVIGPTTDYAVFASTAMFLNGEDMVAKGHQEGKVLMKLPGDFDAALFKLEDLEGIRQRLRNMADRREPGKTPDVIFSNAKKDENDKLIRDAQGRVVYEGKPGEYGTIAGQDLKILAGKLIYPVEIDGKSEEVAYDFEFFLNSKMVTRDVVRDRTLTSHGLKILNLDGLADQYERNLQYEVKTDASVQRVVEALHTTDPEAKAAVDKFKSEILSIQTERSEPDNEDADLQTLDDVALTDQTRDILHRLEVSPAEMKKVFKIQDELDAIKAAEAVPYEKLSAEGVFELYTKAYREAGDDERADRLEKTYKHVQELISKRATLLAGAKTKIWKRDLNLLQLARLRGTRE